MRGFGIIAIAVLYCCQGASAADLAPAPTPLPAAPALPAPPPPESGRFIYIEENDALMPSPTDRWYTQGLQLGYLSAPVRGTPMAVFLPAYYLDPGSFSTRRFEIIFGQSIFTPENLRLNPPDPTDRPYAGWLYAGAGLYQETDRHSLDHVQLLVGIVGPAALGEEVQNGFHHLISGVNSQVTAAGWGSQLKNEPGLVLTYDHRWRWGGGLGAGLAADIIPEFGATVGNVFDYAEAGAMLRLGHNLNADYGPERMQPAYSGTAWFDPSQLQGPLGWYIFVGAQGQVIARNIFLAGNTFESSAHVTEEPLVANLSGGFSLFWADLAKLDFVLTWRGKEFTTQREADRYGGINISFKVP